MRIWREREGTDEEKKSCFWSHLVCCSVGNEEAISVACTIQEHSHSLARHTGCSELSM